MRNGKTIKQIADEIGVSKQAVQKRIAREPLHSSVYAYIDKVGGVLYIAYTGEMLIKQAFADNKCIQVADNQPTTNIDNVYSVLKATIDTLQEQLNVKDNQILLKDKQIEELNLRLAEAHKMVEQAQQLHGADKALELKEAQEPKLLEEQKPKKGWQFWK